MTINKQRLLGLFVFLRLSQPLIKLIKMLQWCLLLDTFSLFSMWSGMEKCGKPFLFYSLFFSWKECNEGCRGCKGRRSPLLHHAPYVQFSDPLKIRRPPVKTNVLTVKKEIVWAGKWVHFSREKLPPASKMHLVRTALQLLNRITNGIEQVI